MVNDSKVIAARLTGRRIGRGAAEPAIEATLHKRLDGSHWRAFILGAKKVQVGDTLRFGAEGKVCFLGELDAQVSQKDEGGEVTLSFSFHGPVLDQAIAERDIVLISAGSSSFPGLWSELLLLFCSSSWVAGRWTGRS